MDETKEFDTFQNLVFESGEGNAVTLSYDQAKRLVEEMRKVRSTAWRAERLEAEIDRFEEWLKKRGTDEHMYWQEGSVIDRANRLLAHYEHERNSALRLLGSLVEHTVISLRAVQMVVKQCHSATHRQIDARLDVAHDAIQEAINVLLDDRSRNWEYMETDLFGRKDWDFRRLAAENARLHRLLEKQGVKESG
jgi:hypothetical protein